jgi:alpha-1,2-mannosyltransferase
VFSGGLNPGAAGPQTGRAGGTRLVIGGVLACAVAVAFYFVSFFAHPLHMGLNWFDFRVYVDGGQMVRHSPGALYSWRLGPEVRFTYTPFAAVLFGLVASVPWAVAKWLMTAASIAALVLTVSMTLGQLGWARRRRLGAAAILSAAAFWFEPVQRALHLGQIELILMALIVWDLGPPARHRWRGAGIGLAAGIKLVPLIFIPYLLLTRRFRQAGVATAVLAGTVLTGFLVLPRASRQWWLTGYFMDAGRAGGVASLANQSLRGLITRLAGSVAAGAPASLWIAALMGVIGVLAAAVLHQSGRPVYGWVLCALTGLLVSPISWDHHWVWMVPALVAFVDTAVRSGRARRWAAWAAAGAVLAVFADWPGQVPGDGSLVPRGVLPLVYGPGEHPYGQLYHWHGSELILGNAYVLAGLVLFGALAVTARHARRSPARPPGRPAAGRVPAARPAGVDPELIPGMSRN